MVLPTEKFAAVCASLFITATGLALVVIGAILLSYAAYFSPWVPSWIWMPLAAFTAFGVAVTAVSCVTAIANVPPYIYRQAAHKWLVLLLMLLVIEIYMSALAYVWLPLCSIPFFREVEDKMQDSLNVYSTNETSAAMWDEIQNELSCCGLVEYKDWFTSGFGDGSSVPDSCCLLPNPGCGKDVRDLPDVNDIINTRRCSRALEDSCYTSYSALIQVGLLPIFVIQGTMVMVLVVLYLTCNLLSGRHVPIRVKGMTAPQPHYSLMA